MTPRERAARTLLILGVSDCAMDKLGKMGIKTIFDLQYISEDELKRVDGRIGKLQIQYLKTTMDRLGIKYKS
jgi:predicted RecB family nuclease